MRQFLRVPGFLSALFDYLKSGEPIASFLDDVPTVAKNAAITALEIAARLAANDFDVFITGDRHLQYQQHLSKLPMAVTVPATRNNLASLRPLVPRLPAQLRVLPLAP